MFVCWWKDSGRDVLKMMFWQFHGKTKWRKGVLSSENTASVCEQMLLHLWTKAMEIIKHLQPPHTDLDGSGQSAESITNHHWSFFTEMFHICAAGLTAVTTADSPPDGQWTSARLKQRSWIHSLTLSHKLPLFHFSKLTSALIQPRCECVSFEAFKSGPMPGWAGLHVWLRILLLLTDICKQMHEAPDPLQVLSFFWSIKL